MVEKKKVKLLSDADRKSSVKKPSTTIAATASVSATAQPDFKGLPYDERNAQSSGTFVKSVAVLLGLLLTALALFPKPALLHYQKDGIATQSIYWSGFMQYPAVLLDSQLAPSLDMDRNELTLCDGAVIKDGVPTCTVYRVEKQEGMLAAWRVYKTQH